MLQKAQVDTATSSPRRQVEQNLVEAAKSGDRSAFGALVAMHKRRVCRVAFTITRNHEDAEDVAQVVFLKAFAAIQDFEGRSSLLTWLTRITVNESLMQIRRRGAVISLDDDPHNGGGEFQIADTRPTPEQSYRFEELHRFLLSALERLTPSLRVVLELHLEGYSGKETAEVLGSSIASVKTRLFRARTHLRSQATRFLYRAAQSGEAPRSAMTRAYI